MKVHYSSKKHDWETPQALFDVLNEEFEFDVDICASPDNAKCEVYVTKEMDALSFECWPGGPIWMNPPYGREIGKWIRKAYLESLANPTPIVCLIPARTDTNWWHDYVMKATEIRFIKGRLKFSNHENSAPFPSAIVIFDTPLNPRCNGNLPVCKTMTL